MKIIKTQNKVPLFHILLGLGVLPTFLFFAILTSEIPEMVLRLFNSLRLVHFLGLVLIFFLIFQFNTHFAKIITCIFLAVLFALPMAINLTYGVSNATLIGGFIPYKDGFYYYIGAEKLLAGQRISALGLQGAWRPLFPGWLSILLLITNRNLLLALGLMTLITAYCCFFASETIRSEFGPLPAAFFTAMIYAFIRPMLGTTLTEIPSLGFANLSVILLMNTVRSKKFLEAVLGGFLLILAISIRAGAFFILPFLVIWLGWHLRGSKRLSFSTATAYGTILLVLFLAANVLFPRLTTEPGASTFGNFSYMLYGQAVGGAGFNFHLEALGTHDPDVVMQAALERIHSHPLSLMIGFAKSYRDFFINNTWGMFDLLSGETANMELLFWLLMISLLIFGLARSLRDFKQPMNALLLACFIGLLLSIPFLPPIDGGSRFYSGSVSFLFALMTVYLPPLHFGKKDIGQMNATKPTPIVARSLAAIFTVALLAGPILILNTSKKEASKLIECRNGLTAIQTEYTNGSFIDILPDEDENCGKSPKLCISVFERNGRDKKTDDFYNLLVELAEDSSRGIRFWAGVNWFSGQHAFMVLPLDTVDEIQSNQRFNGCAEALETEFQRVRIIEILNVGQT